MFLLREGFSFPLFLAFIYGYTRFQKRYNLKIYMKYTHHIFFSNWNIFETLYIYIYIYIYI